MHVFFLNFKIAFGSKNDTAVLTFAFLAFFFHFVGHLAGFISVGRVFGKVFRILRLDEKKGTCRWVAEQDFSLEFLRQLYIGLCRN